MPSVNSSFRSWINRGLTIALVLCLLTSSTPAAPETIVALARESSVSFAFWYQASGLAKFIQGRGPGSARAQEKQADRDAKVSRIQIFPGDVTVDLSDHVRFSAVAYDRDGDSIGGVKIKWSGQGAIPQAHARISPHGEFEATTPGSFTITAQAGPKSAQVTVTVRAGLRRDLRATPIGTPREVSSRDLPAVKIGSAKEKKDSQSSAAKTRNRQGGNSASARRAHTAAAMPEPMPQGGGGGWDSTNYWSAGRPENRVADPPGAAIDGGAGSGNFQFAAPVVNLPGRGINISLGLAYNSRLWNKANTQISYDNDRGWPAPGFNLGFGKLMGMGVYNGGMLVDADGTRHSYTGNITVYNWGTTFVGHTTDGSFIDYNYQSGTGGPIVWAQAKLANGTVVQYGAMSTAAVYPTSIEDANGNYINITYVNNSGPRIQTITDTMGRVINFSYDANNLLTAITAPGINGASRVLVRFHYHQLTLNYAFSGLTPSVRDSYPWVVDAIFYPATNTGYWLNDTNSSSDSYSTYGMLAKVKEERGMSFSASSLNDMGNVSEGSITRTETYNYPLTPDSSLTDAPTYTSMLEEWTRDGVNLDSATTGYEVHENDNPRKTIITLPNGTKSKQYSYNYSSLPDTDPLKALDGLVYHDVTYVTDENSPLQSSTSTWEQGAYNTPRPTRVEKTDERGQTTAAAFSYGSVYNQVTEVRDYDYTGTSLLRATRTTYQNSSSYTNNHIFNLPLTVEIYAADNTTRVSRTDYQYDGQTLADTPDVVGHDVTHNPYAPPYEVCDCNEWDYWQINCLQWNCNWVSAYNSATDYRGNVTQVTTYANVDNSTATGAITETRGYDITGNMVTASTSCCQQTSFNYTIDTQYAYPLSKTRGSATDAYAQVTTSATYDFYTGLGKSATDANGRPSSVDYDPDTLRPATSTSPTGAHTDYAYDDAQMTVTSTTYLEAHPTHTTIGDKNIKYLNGQGQVRIEKALGVNNTWDEVDITYNNLGQVYQQSRPYRVGTETPVTSTVTYDALGRSVSVTAPEGSVTQTFYNEASRPDVASNSPGETTRVKDAWGRERWGRTDASGRLVEVVEPNPGGDGSVANGGLVTTYDYNTLGNLTQTNQGAQTRSFNYDSLGRLTAQKLAEISATLNDAGTYVGSGTWSDVFTYDERSNLTSRTDARGVKTVYNYNSDPLNRLQSVSWDASGFGDTANPILPAATVTYQYRNATTNTTCDPLDSSGRKDVTQLASVSTSGISTEGYCYDTEGRVSSKTLTLTSRSSYPLATDYIYDSLDRATDVLYPAEYGNGSASRKVVHHDYDIASRLTGLTFDSQSFASSIVYNAASQTTSLNVGTGTNQVNESYNYNAQTGLLDNQTVTRGATTLLNLSYDYTSAGGKRTGQLTKILNNLDHNKDRGYTYDALGRLVQATGGPAASTLSTQTYSYDRYGNRLSVTASGYTAKNTSAGAGSAGILPAMSAQREPGTSPIVREGVIERSSHHASHSTRPDPATPQGGPVFSDDPLVPGVTVIKAVHITELRDAVNQARARAGLAAASWAESVTSGVTIKASHIAELRARLAEARSALGLSAASYTDPNLTAGNTVKAAHVQELRTSVREALGSLPIPTDGLANLSFDPATNRITTSGYAYDAAGNQTRALIPGSSTNSQRFQYDAANRLVKVKADDNSTVLATYTYGSSNERLIAEEGSLRTYYVCHGSVEYIESGGSTTPVWSKSYVYLGNRLLSTLTPNGSGGESVQYHHPDRLGTRLVTDPSNGTSFEQVTLPFGTALNAESTGATNKRFTSYDHSNTTGLDYAVNRHYDAQQGRFTQVDPAGMNATSLGNPQSLNLYSYCSNDPINRIDPDGLGILSFIAKIYRAVKKILKWVAIVVAVAFVVVLMFAVLNLPGAQVLADVFFKGLGLLLKFMAHAGIMHLAEAGGGLTIGLTGQILAGAMTVGAIANHFQQNRRRRNRGDKKKQDPTVAIIIDIPTGQSVLASQKTVDKLKREQKAHDDCVAHETDIFNQNVEKIKKDVEDATDRKGILGAFGDFLNGLFQRMPSEPGERLPQNPGEGVYSPGPDIALAIKKREDIEKATKKAAADRDQAIKKNCKEPPWPPD